jgi:hypothetical protein
LVDAGPGSAGGSFEDGSGDHQLLPVLLAPSQSSPGVLPAVSEGTVQLIQDAPNLPGYPTEHRHSKEREREREKERGSTHSRCTQPSRIFIKREEEGERERGGETEKQRKRGNCLTYSRLVHPSLLDNLQNIDIVKRK